MPIGSQFVDLHRIFSNNQEYMYIQLRISEWLMSPIKVCWTFRVFRDVWKWERACDNNLTMFMWKHAHNCWFYFLVFFSRYQWDNFSFCMQFSFPLHFLCHEWNGQWVVARNRFPSNWLCGSWGYLYRNNHYKTSLTVWIVKQYNELITKIPKRQALPSGSLLI